jgi:hypothetical protein
VVGGGGADPAVGGCGGVGGGCGGVGEGGVRLCWGMRWCWGRRCAPALGEMAALGESREAAHGGARAGELLEPRRRRAWKQPSRCGSRPHG